MLEWRPTVGGRTSNALIPIVGDEAVNAEDHTTICGGEELAYRGSKDKIRTHKERERGTKNISIFIEMQQLQIRTTNNHNLYKGYKVTLYSD